MNVYFLSGLGANSKAFKFLDLSFCNPVFIEWIKPLQNESLQHYALRLKENIKDEQPVIVGVSLGGMLATEMAKADPAVQAIIISSNKTSVEFPAYLRMWKYLPVYKWVPGKVIKLSGHFTKAVMGPKGTAQKQLFTDILRDSDPGFVRWAVDAILHWNSLEVPANITHIHGTADRLLPFRTVKADHIIKGGTHLMIMDNHEELSELLKKLILK